MNNPMSRLGAMFVLAVALALTACGGGTEPSPTADSLSALPRTLTAVETDAIAAGNRFALSLLRESNARADGANVLLSPLSVSLALGLTMNGAAGETESQMSRTLGWRSRLRAEINAAYRDLMTLLPSLDPSVKITLANGIWVRSGLLPDTGFVSDAKRFFSADVRSAASPRAMFDAVNAWGNTQTKGLVPRVLETEPPNDLQMLLANAVTFDGTWRDRFDVAKTAPGPFQLERGATVSLPMMQRDGGFRAVRDASMQAVELSYGNSAYTMLLLVPATGTVSGLVATLDSARLATITASLSPVQINTPLTMPRFRVTKTTELGPGLSSMGMPRAFSDGAEFPRLVSGGGVKIGFVRHGVALDVDEAGTRAAAVTAGGIVPISLPQPYAVDRPFVFLIRERFAGTMLFAGVVRDPR